MRVCESVYEYAVAHLASGIWPRPSTCFMVSRCGSRFADLEPLHRDNHTSWPVSGHSCPHVAHTLSQCMRTTPAARLARAWPTSSSLSKQRHSRRRLAQPRPHTYPHLIAAAHALHVRTALDPQHALLSTADEHNHALHVSSASACGRAAPPLPTNYASPALRRPASARCPRIAASVVPPRRRLAPAAKCVGSLTPTTARVPHARRPFHSEGPSREKPLTCGAWLPRSVEFTQSDRGSSSARRSGGAVRRPVRRCGRGSAVGTQSGRAP